MYYSDLLLHIIIADSNEYNFVGYIDCDINGRC